MLDDIISHGDTKISDKDKITQMEESRSEKKKHKKNKEYEDDKILFQYQQAESLKITALMTGIDRKINDIDKKINTYKESVLKDINNIGGIMIYFKDVKAEFKKST
jgi:hypothetical protein